ncbi:MAG TPA: hypothetical protein VNP73_07720 [Actinomycetota bacterium]|nr:hypothetical protein [Actinomycetota bacterium]
MPRGRRPEDWEKDLAQARRAEADLAQILAGDSRLDDFLDHTMDYDKLDFSFAYAGLKVQLDLKEKRQRYSPDYQTHWPEVALEDLFIIDETVYRRIVWQGGGGYLAVHDHPSGRWCYFGPWELTLGPQVRYQRWGKRSGRSFLKGKILLDLNSAAYVGRNFVVDDLLRVILRSAEALGSVEAVAINGYPTQEVGKYA